MVTVLDVAGFPLTQVIEELTVAYIASLLAKFVAVRLGPVPEATPFRYQVMVPLPEFVADALKVTLVPAQMAPEGVALILSETGSTALTVM
jgi:hypothetical protein